MPAKKRKKKAPGGPQGRPAFSEPRVQVFSKFAGCNFQLATRDFDSIFEADQDAQTDLMPMLMAIQNNAEVVPLGGIATRQNIVELFDAPTYQGDPVVPDGTPKILTGVATLIGDEVYVACTDMTIYHRKLGSAEWLPVQITDLNQNYGAATKHSYTGVV